jgi:hypothetical protein
LEVGYEGETLVPAALLAGWVAARAGWRTGKLERDDGRAAGIATRPDGGEVTVALERDPEARGCGGIEALTLRAESSEVRIKRGAATSRLRDLFGEALRPLASYGRGYAEALGAAATMMGDAPRP